MKRFYILPLGFFVFIFVMMGCTIPLGSASSEGHVVYCDHNYDVVKESYKSNKGSTVKKEYLLEPFETLRVSSALNVIVSKGREYRLTAVGSSSLMDKIRVRNNNGTLSLSLKGEVSYRKKERLQLYVTTPSLNCINVSGASVVKGLEHANVFEANKMRIDLSGASVISNLNLRSDYLSIEVSGASAMKMVAVESNSTAVDVSGCSSFNMTNKSDQLSLDVSGASSVMINGVANYVAASASGASLLRLTNLIVRYGKVSATGASQIRLGKGEYKTSKTKSSVIK